MSAREISKKWTMPVRDWELAYQQFAIFFEDRLAALWIMRGLCPRAPEVYPMGDIGGKWKTAAFCRRFPPSISQPASGRSSALPSLAALLFLPCFFNLNPIYTVPFSLPFGPTITDVVQVSAVDLTAYDALCGAGKGVSA